MRFTQNLLSRWYVQGVLHRGRHKVGVEVTGGRVVFALPGRTDASS